MLLASISYPMLLIFISYLMLLTFISYLMLQVFVSYFILLTLISYSILRASINSISHLIPTAIFEGVVTITNIGVFFRTPCYPVVLYI